MSDKSLQDSQDRHDPARGLLLFAHGARDPQWALPFEAVAQRCRAARGADRVALAFLEFMTPALPWWPPAAAWSTWCPCFWALAAMCAKTYRC